MCWPAGFMNCPAYCCLLYTSDAADERSSVDLGGRRIIKKKREEYTVGCCNQHEIEHNNTRTLLTDETTHGEDNRG
mgnify:CR=1 FL=1